MQGFLLVVLCCVLWEAKGYPFYPYYANFDSMALGATDNSRGGMVMSRYYNPYYNPRGLGGGMASFMYRPEQAQQTPDVQQAPQTPQVPSQYNYIPERRRQTSPDVNINLMPPQENEVFPPLPDKPATDIAANPTDKIETTTTLRTIEITESEIEDLEPVEKPKKRLSKKKQVQKPVDDEEEEDLTPKMPMGAFFPMFFGYGGRGRSEGGTPGPMAIANAYSTGRGGVATSHATAYGNPQPDFRNYNKHE